MTVVIFQCGFYKNGISQSANGFDFYMPYSIFYMLYSLQSG